jgi:hypothetical protein
MQDVKDADESKENKTALLPKDFFGKDLEVGKTCKVRVTHIYEDEVEVEYVGHGEKDEEKEPSEFDSAVDKMAEEDNGYAR